MTQENAGADAVLGAAAGLAGGAVAGAIGAFKAASAVMDRLSAGPSTQQFHVDKDTVLQAGRIVEQQFDQLEAAYKRNVPKLRIPATGDKVTEDVVNAWNDRLVFHEDSYANRISLYMEKLRNLSDQLKSSAEQYGFTEDEITAVFSNTKKS
ncbi:hypothetical protein [Lentzea sp.]|uniref:hypothetical protein n=1 Tax=Lentzea sp. TaxID=56099 RepID=UPI002C1C86FC|nr:hypothetical protein [Lentzea sp.]HUQ59235.1 hypothetical protein [Lentzea sp.]